MLVALMLKSNTSKLLQKLLPILIRMQLFYCYNISWLQFCYNEYFSYDTYICFMNMVEIIKDISSTFNFNQFIYMASNNSTLYCYVMLQILLQILQKATRRLLHSNIATYISYKILLRFWKKSYKNLHYKSNCTKMK